LDLALTTPEGRFVASADYDFGLQRAGKAEASWTRPFRDGRWLMSVGAIRYVPYFSLSTIWGFFEPVPYHGVQARGAWSVSSAFTVWAIAGWRTYGDTETETVLSPLVDDGKRGELGGRWAAGPEITLEGSYQLEWSAGAFLSSVDAAVRWSPSERLGIALDATTFQQVEEFRLGDGRGYGAGASADATLLGRLGLSGGISLLRHRTPGAGVGDSPWNQARAWTSVRVRVGEDPGLPNRGSR
jgi:hypothetical protein